jgi:GST-like protein
MEVKRQLDVLNNQLADKEFICGDEYTIADMAIWAWYGAMVLGKLYEAAEFLDVESYTHLLRWAKKIDARDAVKRGKMVNRSWGQPEGQLLQRNDASDFENKTQDKLEPSE